jgi:GTP pyrophosphokinase
MRRKDRENHIHNIVQELKLLLDHAGIKHAKITGRAKHIYSIYRKIQHKHVNFEKIYDASAVRILVPTLEDCYTTLSVVHNTWTHIPEEFDDYIAKPKANGYQSIHTAVSNDHDLVFEIQIRTFAMHESSELGIASHWKYKEKDSATPEKQYEQKINWLRELMDWQRELTQEDPQHKDLYSKIFKDQIYVFTPDNDVLDLAAGATPLDFAYHVHTQVGHRCKGAKVNGHIVPLSHALQTGDRVEIITGKEPHPSRDWLSQNSGYLKTHHARVKVRHWFRQLNHEQHVAHGEELWEKAHRRYHFSKDALKKAAKLFGFETNERFLSEVGSGHLGIQTVVHRLLGSPEPSSAHEPVVPTTTQAPPHHISEMNIEGVDGLLMQLARCCQPIPGDEIIGYITKGRGITIHHKNCRNIQQALQYRSQRTIHVNWSGASLKKFSVDLFIEAEDRPGLIRDISNIIANEHIPILRLNTQVNTLENRCFIQTSLQVSSLTTLADIIRKIELTPSIQSVMRKTI